MYIWIYTYTICVPRIKRIYADPRNFGVTALRCYVSPSQLARATRDAVYIYIYIYLYIYIYVLLYIDKKTSEFPSVPRCLFDEHGSFFFSDTSLTRIVGVLKCRSPSSTDDKMADEARVEF